MNPTSQDTLLKIRETEYINFLNYHIGLVNNCFILYENFIPIKFDKDTLKSMLLMHDKSSFVDIEFVPFRKKYFPIDGADAADNPNLEQAINYHLMHNSHHPEYWVPRNWFLTNKDSLEMGNESIIEMVFDWVAKGIVEGYRCYDYFNNNDRLKEIMHPNSYAKTKDIVQAFMTRDNQSIR